MKWIGGLLGLLYDLVIGDCWQIAAGSMLVLGAGIGILKSNAIKPALFGPTLGSLIMIAAALIIYWETRIRYRRTGGTSTADPE